MKHILFIAFILSFLSGCNSHAYYDEAQIFISDVHNIFIKNAVCESKQDCSNRELVKFEAGGWSLGPLSGGGVSISVYQISSDAVVQILHSTFSQRHSEMPDVPVQLHAYSSKHGATKVKIAEYAYQ